MQIAFFTGLASFLFCAAFQSQIDEKIPRLRASLLAFIRSRVRDPEPHRIHLLTHLIASLRAGMSLDSGIESAARNPTTPPELRAYLEAILRSGPNEDFLGGFLTDALRTGTPVLATLQIFQKILQVERRVRMKARALTSQSRAQAEVLSWLPWLMLSALALLDWEWFLGAGEHPGSWLAWSIALLLLAGGRHWIRSALGKALRPRSGQENIDEKFLPELILRLIAEISLGLDAETALEKNLARMKNPALNAEFSSKTPSGNVALLRSLLHHSALTGAPLREDLTHFLTDLHLQIESRWEERVQRLPVAMMAPLFLCFFPSCLLVLLAVLLPVIGEGI
jgi:hypothetical protein